MCKINELLRKDYIDVYEQMYLEDRCEFLFAVWRDIIMPNSDKTPMQLDFDKRSIVNQLSEDFNITINDSVNIASIDRNVVITLLKLSIKLKKVSLIDFIFKRTKSSAMIMPQYFYYEELMSSYIKLLEIDKAKQILEYVYSLEHRSYLYKIVEIKNNKYKEYPEFYKTLIDIQGKSIAKLLKDGEDVNVTLNLNMLLKLNQYI